MNCRFHYRRLRIRCLINVCRSKLNFYFYLKIQQVFPSIEPVSSFFLYPTNCNSSKLLLKMLQFDEVSTQQTQTYTHTPCWHIELSIIIIIVIYVYINKQHYEFYNVSHKHVIINIRAPVDTMYINVWIDRGGETFKRQHSIIIFIAHNLRLPFFLSLTISICL